MVETPQGRSPSQDTSPEPGRKTARPSGAWRWAAALMAVALVVLALIAAGAYVAREALRTPERTVDKAADRLEGMAGKVFDKIRDGLRPSVTVRTSVGSQVARLNATPKLVVLTETVDVEVAKSSEKRVLWGLLNLGTTEVRLKAPGNKVQFFIPLKEIKEEDFVYQPATKKVLVRVPAPVLDRQVVDVQSDPAEIEVETKVGWARLSAFSGRSLERQAKEALRQEVLSAADTPPMHDLARVQAEKTLRAFFGELEAGLRAGVRLEFEFKAAANAPP
jgi:hypothetical protein